jgi:hAT family C-terminal dimerisation region
MLQKLVRLKTSLCIFHQYLKSPEGKREFNHKRLPTFCEEDWALIEGICIIVGKFAAATEALSGEKYPTFVYSMPILRSIKMHLSNEELFLNDSCQSQHVKTFFSNYGTEPFMPSVISTLETIRKGLLQECKQRFSNMTIDILWTTILDPRCRSLKHLSPFEKKEAKERLIEEVLQGFQSKIETKHPIFIVDEENKPDLHLKGFDIFDSPVKNTTQQGEELEVNELLQRKSAIGEVENYLDHSIHVSPQVSSLEWWKFNKHQFPHITVVARKWLCVPATSTPSKRVFSDCGLALTAKRSRLKGNILRDQVMIRRNVPCLNITQDDIQTKFAKNK